MMTRRQMLAATVGLLGGVAASCSRASDEQPIYTGATLTSNQVLAQVGAGSFGKTLYAVVNRDWLLWCYPGFRAWMSEGQFGVTGWGDRSQCTLFASAFEVYCQKRYHAHAFHSAIPAPGIAVGTMWYPATPELGHALNVAVTQQGRELWEPQVGRFVTLDEVTYGRAGTRKFD